ncbi:MAG: AbrB/MazE/SpoVT family DNA-binding domain-containing protein [Oceanipulchritudo sp.]
MKTVLKVDPMGRVLLPMPLRRQFGLHKGSRLNLKVRDGTIELKPDTRAVGLTEEEGLAVHEGKLQGYGGTGIREARESRDRSNWGV